MSAKVSDGNEPYDEINVTPMLDLAYVLLVIFIIMTTASVQGIKVNLPKASNTPSLAKPTTKVVLQEYHVFAVHDAVATGPAIDVMRRSARGSRSPVPRRSRQTMANSSPPSRATRSP